MDGSVVLKLGSSIVADPQGEVRLDVLGPAVRGGGRPPRGNGDSVVIVTSGAIARGMRLMELPARPASMEELQAASAVGQGRLYRAYDELLAGARRAERPGAAHLLRHVRAHATT